MKIFLLISLLKEKKAGKNLNIKHNFNEVNLQMPSMNNNDNNNNSNNINYNNNNN